MYAPAQLAVAASAVALFRETVSVTVLLGGVLVTMGAVAEPSRADSAADDLKIDRKEVYEFTKKPTVAPQGDRVTIRFASKDYCDAAVAIEREDGRILRHLAYGVLGPNAPEPYAKDSLEQEIAWDGKDDAGRPVEDMRKLAVRVSLGLKARVSSAESLPRRGA